MYLHNQKATQQPSNLSIVCEHQESAKGNRNRSSLPVFPEYSIHIVKMGEIKEPDFLRTIGKK